MQRTVIRGLVLNATDRFPGLDHHRPDAGHASRLRCRGEGLAINSPMDCLAGRGLIPGLIVLVALLDPMGAWLPTVTPMAVGRAARPPRRSTTRRTRLLRVLRPVAASRAPRSPVHSPCPAEGGESLAIRLASIKSGNSTCPWRYSPAATGPGRRSPTFHNPEGHR